MLGYLAGLEIGNSRRLKRKFKKGWSDLHTSLKVTRDYPKILGDISPYIPRSIRDSRNAI
jgi:hypothetical protein